MTSAWIRTQTVSVATACADRRITSVTGSVVRIKRCATWASENAGYSGNCFLTTVLFIVVSAQRGKLNTPCLPSNVDGNGCTDSNTQCLAGSCVCADDYYEKKEACSKIKSRLSRTPVWVKFPKLNLIFCHFAAPKIALTYACSVSEDDQCLDPKSECRAGRCQCVRGFSNKDNVCGGCPGLVCSFVVPKKMTPTEFLNSQLFFLFSPSAREGSPGSIWSLCRNGTTCSDVNAHCQKGICMCRDEFFEKAGTCSKSTLPFCGQRASQLL